MLPNSGKREGYGWCTPEMRHTGFEKTCRRRPIPSIPPPSSTASAAGSRSRPDRGARAGQQARRPRRPRLSRPAGDGGAGRRAFGLRRSSRRALVMGQDEPGILVLSHLDTVHPMGFIERLPFGRGRQRLRPRHLRHEGRRLSRLPCVPADLRRRRASAAWHHPALRLRRGDRQPDLARADRGRGTQGEIRAGDRAGPRRRQDRHRAQGRRALRGLHQGRAVACRHPTRGRPQRHPRTRPMSSRRWKR